MNLFDTSFDATERFHKVIDSAACEIKQSGKCREDVDPVNNEYAYNLIAYYVYALLDCSNDICPSAREEIVSEYNAIGMCSLLPRELAGGLAKEQVVPYCNLLREIFFHVPEGNTTFLDLFFGGCDLKDTPKAFILIHKCLSKVYDDVIPMTFS